MDLEISQKRVLDELAQIAFASCGDYLSVKDGVLTVADMPKGAAMGAVQSVEKTSSGIRVKFYDKLKALELLGKAVGLFDGIESGGENNLLSAIVSATKEGVDTCDIPELQ